MRNKKNCYEYVIKVSENDIECTEGLCGRLARRHLEETGKLLTEYERDLCWWSICSIVMRDGYEAGREYVDTVEFL